jgi:hypothetical protein
MKSLSPKEASESNKKSPLLRNLNLNSTLQDYVGITINDVEDTSGFRPSIPPLKDVSTQQKETCSFPPMRFHGNDMIFEEPAQQQQGAFTKLSSFADLPMSHFRAREKKKYGVN